MQRWLLWPPLMPFGAIKQKPVSCILSTIDGTDLGNNQRARNKNINANNKE